MPPFALLILKDVQRSKVNKSERNLDPEFLSHPPTHTPCFRNGIRNFQLPKGPQLRTISKALFTGLCHCLVAKAAINF